MNKVTKKYFNQLWKVKILKEIANFEDGFINECGKITRSSKFDNERTLRLIEYGFKEGLKFPEPSFHEHNHSPQPNVSGVREYKTESINEHLDSPEDTLKSKGCGSEFYDELENWVICGKANYSGDDKIQLCPECLKKSKSVTEEKK